MTPPPAERPTAAPSGARSGARAWWSSSPASPACFRSASRAAPPPPMTRRTDGAVRLPANALVAPLARWDSVWYLTIARSGYAAHPRADGVLPAVPGADPRRSPGSSRSDLVAGVLISLVAFAVALALLHRLVRLDFADEVADTTVMLLAFCPMAFFFSAVYTRVAVPGAVGRLDLRRAARALARSRACSAALAALSRNGGIALILPTGRDLPLRPARRRADARAHALGPPRPAPAGARLLPRYRLAPDAALAAADPGRARRLPRLSRHQVRPRARAVPRRGGLVPPHDLPGDDDLGWRQAGLGWPAAADPRPDAAVPTCPPTPRA